MNIKYFVSGFVIGGIMLTCSLMGQTPPLKHEKKIYKDSESQKLYWPLDMPFYIWLSASPEESAPAFLLDQMVIDDVSGKTKPVTEGIKLELSGNQFVRWVNSVSLKDTKMKFYSDGDAPVTNDSLFDAPRHSKSGTVYFGHDLKCKLKPKDKLSGVANTYYSIDGKAFEAYKTPLSFNTEKPVNLRYYAVDNTGYAEDPKSIDFIVDKSSPVTHYETEINFMEEVLSGKTKIKLPSEDELSGVHQVFYKYDDNEYKKYSSPLLAMYLDNGEHTIKYYAVDKVENKEKEQSFTFYVDKEAPKPDISIRGEQHIEGEKWYISSHSLMQLSATDDKIGVDNIFYKINNSKDFRKYENPFPLSMKSGQFSISYYVKDKLGNTSQLKKRYLQMDLTPPKTENKIEGPHYAQRSTVWINKETKIKLLANDGQSGLKKINYVIGNDQAKDYNDKPIQISEEGNYLFRYFGFDNVNNREGDNVLLLISDNTPPDIKEIFSVSPLDTISAGTEDQSYAFPQYTTLFLAATDMSSGLKEVRYSINGGEEKEYFSSILCDKIGNYDIDIQAVDNLGHSSSKSLKFTIKKLEIPQ
ncbi:hypothetical protein OAO55_03020 [Bacteroidales bacterium]|nr:hypothetical protein [Bacteroidales bacterium]